MIESLKIVYFRFFGSHKGFYATDLKGRIRPICDAEIDGVHGWDAPKFCDAFLSSCVWADTLQDLTEEELDRVNDDSQLVHEITYDQLY